MMKQAVKTVCALLLSFAVLIPGMSGGLEAAAVNADSPGGHSSDVVIISGSNDDDTYAPYALTYNRALEITLSGLSGLLSIDDTLLYLDYQRTLMRRQIWDLDQDPQLGILASLGNTIGYLMGEIERIVEELTKLLDPDEGGGEPDEQLISELTNQRQRLQMLLNDSNNAWDAIIEARANVEAARDIMAQNIEIMGLRMESMTIAKEMLRISAELSLRSALTGLAAALRDVEMMELTIAQSEENLKRARIMNDFGLGSSSELLLAELALAQDYIRMENLEIALDNAHMSLAKLLRQPLSTAFILEYSRIIDDVSSISELSLSNAIENDLTIKQLEIDIEISKIDVRIREIDMMNRRRSLSIGAPDAWPARSRAYEQALFEYENALRAVSAAERDMVNARRDLEANIYVQGNALRRLSLQEQSILLEMKMAEAQLAAARVRYSLGQITQFDLDKATLSVFLLECSLENNRDAQWVQQFRMQYTFLP